MNGRSGDGTGSFDVKIRMKTAKFTHNPRNAKKTEITSSHCTIIHTGYRTVASVLIIIMSMFKLSLLSTIVNYFKILPHTKNDESVGVQLSRRTFTNHTVRRLAFRGKRKSRKLFSDRLVQLTATQQGLGRYRLIVR